MIKFNADNLIRKEVNTDGTASDHSIRFCLGIMSMAGIGLTSILGIILLSLGGLAILASLVLSIIALAVALKKKS